MKGKALLATFLLAVGFCFVPALGYGEIHEAFIERSKARVIDSLFLQAKIRYIMRNPTIFLDVDFMYDEEGVLAEEFPEGVDTEGKIVIEICDNRELFPKVKSLQSLSERDKINLLDFFKATLENLYSYIWWIATDMDTDIVGKFFLIRTDPDDASRFRTGKETISLAYFYEGEYHLWER